MCAAKRCVCPLTGVTDIEQAHPFRAHVEAELSARRGRHGLPTEVRPQQTDSGLGLGL
jgi:hypothetical protein